jgi:hypothetical protein
MSYRSRLPAVVTVWLCLSHLAAGADIKLVRKAYDPYGVPRPAPGQQQVPLRTTFYVELGFADKKATDEVLADSITMELEAGSDGARQPLLSGGRFAAGYAGKFIHHGSALGVYVDGQQPLRPATTYTIRLQARSRGGATLPEKAGTWQFTTEAAPGRHPLRLTLAKDVPVVRWHGGFFTGFCGVSFCTGHANRIPTYELMDRVRRSAPRAWSFERDFWLTGMEHQPRFLDTKLPNIVRERETRRITAIDDDARGQRLHVEDFFGHEQYGIASGRPVSADYHSGDEVLIADGVHHARAKVLAAEDGHQTVLVSHFDPPKGGWKLKYAAPLPTKEDPNAPGLFPAGGCYLRKFRPCGTPAYYWGRLDREWDLAVRRFHRRVLVNFADAPGDLSRDGRDWTTAKDYAELHEVTRTIAGHIIDRYGDAALTFPWSVFNEPDLGGLFWRGADWNELQTFYDYSVDAVLRAFEDRGYDSGRVFVGGLELGAIFGTNLRLREFLAHCSPLPLNVKGAVALNAAYADRRLDGKRSRRVEALCRAHDGRGSPCDFISIHAYNRSKMMADKLARAKQIALEIDVDYYARLWVNSHEACPGWDLPPDPAYADSYLGNGYYPTWCADVACRLLRQAAADPRYSYGESILTWWPSPITNFGGANDVTRALHVEDNGGRRGRETRAERERTVTAPMPILHFLGLLAAMGPEFRVLPEQTIGAHTVSGFVAQRGNVHQALVYSHHMLDTESRSGKDFAVTLDLAGIEPGPVLVFEYRYDKDHNSYYRLARELREQEGASHTADAATARQVQDALRALSRKERAERRAALEKLAGFGPAAKSAAATLFQFLGKCEDAAEREQAKSVLKRISAPKVYPAAIARRVEELASLHLTGCSCRRVGADGRLEVTVGVAGNGANVLMLVPVGNVALLPF